MKLNDIKSLHEDQTEASIDMRSVTKSKEKAVHKELDRLLPGLFNRKCFGLSTRSEIII